MNINKKVKTQLEILEELDNIIYSTDFANATFDKQTEILKNKKKELNKLKFLYNLEEALIFEKDKENTQRNRKMA